MCEKLLRFETLIDVNIKNNDGNTPLHYLVRLSNTNDHQLLTVIQSMIEKGADVNCANKYGETPLHCCFRGIPPVAKLLLSSNANPNALSLFFFYLILIFF